MYQYLVFKYIYNAIIFTYNTLFSICMHAWDGFWVLHVGAFQDKSGAYSWTETHQIYECVSF